MAAKEKTAVADGKVEIFVPRDDCGNEETMYIGVNGKGYLLPRGKKSTVPAAVAQEFQRAQAAREMWFQRSEALRESGSEK